MITFCACSLYSLDFKLAANGCLLKKYERSNDSVCFVYLYIKICCYVNIFKIIHTYPWAFTVTLDGAPFKGFLIVARRVNGQADSIGNLSVGANSISRCAGPVSGNVMFVVLYCLRRYCSNRGSHMVIILLFVK